MKYQNIQSKWIELSPSDHRNVYPEPEPATKDFVKVLKYIVI